MKAKLWYILPITLFVIGSLSLAVAFPYYAVSANFEAKAMAANMLAEETPYWQPALDNFALGSWFMLCSLGCFSGGFISTCFCIIASKTQHETQKRDR